MFYGWRIVALGFLGGAFGGAAIWFGFTAFFDPLSKEFGWSYAAISLAASMRGLEVGLIDVVVGFLLDRFGCRRIVFAASLLLATGYLMLSRINSLPTFYIAFILVFLGGTGYSSVVFFAVVSRWFRRRLGLAMGITSAGFGAGGFGVPVIVYLLDLFGLRTTFVVIGIASIVVGGLIAHFLRDRPENVGTWPDGIPPEPDDAVASPDSYGITVARPKNNYSVIEAIGKPPFWVVLSASIAMGFAVSTVTIHIMPYLQHIGYDRHIASLVAMMVPVTSIAGRLGVGVMSDRMNTKTILALSIGGLALGVALLYFARLQFLLVPFLLFFGLGWGGIAVLRPVILKEYYGSVAIGSLIGLCLGLQQLANFSGPLFAGWLFDSTGCYSIAFVTMFCVTMAVSPLILLLKPLPSKNRRSGL